MSLSSILSVAAGSINNINRQIGVLSQNVANVNTPDYSVETGTQSSLDAGGVGSGVQTGPVTRQVNLQLQQALFTQNATVAGLATTSTALAGIDAMQGTPGQGNDLSSLVGALQNAFTTLEADPSNTASQAGAVTAAGNVTGQLNQLSAAYASARKSAETNIASGVQTLNTALTTIGTLTQQIIQATQSGTSTADLENQRDVALQQVSGLIGVTFIQQANGGLLAATSGGLALPLQNPVPQFTVAASATGPGAYYPGGGISGIMLGGTDVTAQLSGGSIGANVTLRDLTLPTYQGELDEFANSLNSRFSAQGLQLFTQPAGGSGSVTQSGYVGYAAAIAVNPAVVADPSQVTNGNVTVAGSASGASAFTPNPSSGPAGFTGLIQRVLNYTFGTDVQSGVAQPQPAVSGLGPAGNLSAPYAAPGDLASFASVVVESQSSDVSNVTSQSQSQTSIQSALQTRLNAVSGVSIDTEMSQMVELQNAYGANARIIEAVQAIWTQLLQAVP